MEIGHHQRVRGVTHTRCHHGVFTEPLLSFAQGLMRGTQIVVQHDEFDGREGASGNGGQPTIGQGQVAQQLWVLRRQVHVLRQRLNQRVAGEFSVPLPLEGVGA